MVCANAYAHCGLSGARTKYDQRNSSVQTTAALAEGSIRYVNDMLVAPSARVVNGGECA